jgi:hypothetical protein
MEDSEDFAKLAKEASKFSYYILGFLLFMLVMATCTVSFASQAVCPMFADMALTSKSLALESVEKEVAKRVMFRMYQPGNLRNEVAVSILIDRAYDHKGELLDFVNKVYIACMETQGRPESFLGTRT